MHKALLIRSDIPKLAPNAVGLIAGGWQRHCGLIVSIHLTNVYSVPAGVLGSVAQAPARRM